jgi:hypothetical protein
MNALNLLWIVPLSISLGFYGAVWFLGAKVKSEEKYLIDP